MIRQKNQWEKLKYYLNLEQKFKIIVFIKQYGWDLEDVIGNLESIGHKFKLKDDTIDFLKHQNIEMAI